MAAGMSKQQINYHLRRLQAKYPETQFVVLRASNGEVAIVPKPKTEADWRRESLNHGNYCTCRWCGERKALVRKVENSTHDAQGRMLHYVDCDGEPIVGPGEIGMTTDEACQRRIKL